MHESESGTTATSANISCCSSEAGSEAGTKRAKEQGLTNCKFQEGDASNLHELNDHTFDLVVSIFGAMFAPKPFDVAKEMVRVSRAMGRRRR